MLLNKKNYYRSVSKGTDEFAKPVFKVNTGHSNGTEGCVVNVLLPQHPCFPVVPMVQGELFFECTLFLYSVLVLFLQYLNLYKTLWWLPNSYTFHAVKFHLVDLYVLSCVGLVLGRRVIWCFLRKFTFSLTGLNNRWTFFLRLFEWALKLPVAVAILTSFSFSFLHVLTSYTPFTLTHLIYPLLVYVVLFCNDICALFSHSIWKIPSVLAHQYNTSPSTLYSLHACSTDPKRIRQEADALIVDVYHRFKRSLFAALTTMYYAILIPCGFAPHYLYIDYLWVSQMAFIVFFTSLTLYLAYLFPIQLCDQMHRCAVHLGAWVRVKNFRLSQMVNMVWSDSCLWSEGCMVKHGKRVYRGDGRCIAATPDSDHQRNFHLLFGDPLRIINLLCIVCVLLIVAQFLMLVHSIEWQHIVTLVMLMFANYVLLFKVFKDKIILGRIYYPSARSAKLKTK